MKIKLDYYSLTLKTGQNAIQVGEKTVPILGVFLSENNMHEILSGKKILENYDNKPIDGLSYISIRELPVKEANVVVNTVMALSIKEKEAYIEELKKIENKIIEDNYINSSYGIGEKMTRRLILSSKKNKEA